nr:DUF6476 family protein [Celeribacter marinus]
MDEPVGELMDIDPAQAAHLTFLRRLVTALTAVMIGGLLVLIVLFVTRFPTISATAPSKTIAFDLPASITLPDGAAPIAFTRGSDWVAITTETEILIYDAATGAHRQTVTLK